MSKLLIRTREVKAIDTARRIAYKSRKQENRTKAHAKHQGNKDKVQSHKDKVDQAITDLRQKTLENDSTTCLGITKLGKSCNKKKSADSDYCNLHQP